MPVEPLLDTKNIWDSINKMLAASTQLEPMTLEHRLLLKRILATRPIAPGHSFMQEGYVRQLVGEFDEMRDAFRKAQPYLSPREFMNWTGAAYTNAGFYSEALKNSEFVTDPTHGDFTRNFHIGMLLGRFQRLSAELETMDRMKLEVTPERRELIHKSTEVATQFGLTPEKVTTTLDLLGQVFRSHRLVCYGEPTVSAWVGDAEEDALPHLAFEFKVARPPEFLSQLRAELAQAIAHSELGCYPEGMVIRLLHAEPPEKTLLAA
jgi:hypothetical protein